MNKKQLYEYGSLYYPYSNNPKWVEWFVKVAPLKVERSIDILLQHKRKNSKLLDYGCGIGFNIPYYAKVFQQVVGIDVDKPSIEIAKKQLKKLNINKKVFHYDGTILPFKDNSFDIICANDVWEHAEKPRIMMKEIHRVLKPDGLLFINTPNKLWPIETHYKLPFLSYLPSSLANKYVKIMKKADRYDDIHLPTYGEFKKSVGEFFTFKDITFDLVKDYKKNKLANERGGVLIPLAGTFLQMLYKLQMKPLIELLNNMSLGWFFLGWPKKKKSKVK